MCVLGYGGGPGGPGGYNNGGNRGYNQGYNQGGGGGGGYGGNSYDNNGYGKHYDSLWMLSIWRSSEDAVNNFLSESQATVEAAVEITTTTWATTTPRHPTSAQ